MSPKFKDYFSKQFKNYLVVVILSTTLLFITLTFGAFQIYTHVRLKNDNAKVSQLFEKELDRIYAEYINLDKSVDFEDTNSVDKLYHDLYSIRSSSQIKYNFTILDIEENVTVTNLYKYNEDLLVASHQLSSAISQLNTFKRDKAVEESISQYNDFQKSTMTMVFKGENSYFVLEPLYESFINLEHELSSNIVITDRYDNILFDNSLRYQDGIGKLLIDKNNNMKITRANDYFNVTNIKPKVVTTGIVLYTITTVGIALLVLLKMLNHLTKKIVVELNAPLDELLTAIEANKDGNLDYFIKEHHFFEFDKIYLEFNNLMHSTKQLMIKNENLAKTKQEIEIKHLKNQFNPHFMYNTLESIRYEVMFDQETASEMLLSLGRLMQYSIENTNTLVSIVDDVKYLEDYLKLQKMRFGERLEYVIDLDENIKYDVIPKLLLQPVIENCIKHNMDRVNKLNIYIHAYKSEECIIFDVRDNGLGISDSRLLYLQASLMNKDNKTNNFGLHNINRAIKLMYGEEYGLSVENKKQGLLVSLKLPIERG